MLAGAALTGWLALGTTETPLGPMRLAPLPEATRIAPADLTDLSSPPPMTFEKISPVEAELRNALLPFSHIPLLPGAMFSASEGAPAAAAECMTAAIYYEAGREPEAGKRAVAQVILNRSASPAFPRTICGVVQQGAGRPGCQFTFMCDGSLGRRPEPNAWAGAHEIAEEALAGYVDTAVGAATHYHADYVFPTWAPSMIKLIKIGQHIFYRWPGAASFPHAATQVTDAAPIGGASQDASAAQPSAPATFASSTPPSAPPPLGAPSSHGQNEAFVTGAGGAHLAPPAGEIETPADGLNKQKAEGLAPPPVVSSPTPRAPAPLHEGIEHRALPEQSLQANPS